VRRRGRPEPEAVDEAGLGRRRERVQRRPEPRQVRAVQAVVVDLARRDHADGDPLGAADDGAEELLALRLGALLRVVQERKWPHAVVAQAAVVEEDAGDDERPGERPPARLVRSRHEPRAQTAVEAKQPLAGPARHAREHTAGDGRPLCRFRRNTSTARACRAALEGI
jgi:hypothetical protein